MRKIYLAAMTAVSLSLCACSLEPPASPSTIAASTKLDEQVGNGVELAYKAARLVVETMVDTGFLKGQRAASVALADTRAFAAVQAMRDAYDVGNSQTYVEAAAEAQKAVEGILAAINGE